MTQKAEGFVAEGEVGSEGGYALDTDDNKISADFNVETEYKPSPLIPNGTYHGNVTDVKLDVDQQCIVFTLTLNENGGLMSDGETPIDGQQIASRVWLPRPGDENEQTKDGRMNKRQSKINMMMDYAKKMKISLSKPLDIIQAIRNSDWIGLDVSVKVAASEYEGRVRNDVKDVKAFGSK